MPAPGPADRPARGATAEPGDTRGRGLLRRGIGRLIGGGTEDKSGSAGRTAAQPSSTVCVVVTASPTQRLHLDGCRHALAEQTHADVCVHVVEYGDPGDSGGSGESDRLRTLGAARNVGADACDGTYLVFLEATDRLEPTALATMVDSLERTGSDLARGDWQEEGGQEHRRPTYGSALTLDRAWPAITDTRLANTVFRSACWERAGLRYDEGPGAPVEPVLARALTTGTFDLIDEVVGAGPRPGSDGTPAWLASAHATAPEHWDLLCDALAPIVLADAADAADSADDDAADRDGLMALGWESRVKAWLVARRDRASLEEFVESRRVEGGDHPSRVREGRVYVAAWPADHPTVGVPEDCVELTEAESPLVASLRQIRWIDQEHLELDVFAFVSFVGTDGDGLEPELSADLVDGDGDGVRVPLEVSAGTDPAVTRFAGHRYQGYDRGAYRIVVDSRPLVGSPTWSLELELTVAGVTRRGTLTHRERNGTVGERPRRLSDGMLWGPSPLGDDGIRIDVTRPAAVLRSATVSGRHVTGVVTAPNLDLAGLELVHADRDPVAAKLTDQPSASTGTAFGIELPDLGFTNAESQDPEWRLRAVDADGNLHPVAYDTTAGADDRATDDRPTDDRAAATHAGCSVAWHRGREGQAVVREVGYRPEIENLTLVGDEIVVRLRWPGVAPEPHAWGLSLVSDRVRLSGTVQFLGENAAQVRIDTTCDEWGLGNAIAPTGAYRLELTVDETGVTTTSLPVAEQLTARTPYDLLGHRIRVRVRQNARRRLAVHLLPPLRDDELGPRAQELLRAAYGAGLDKLDQRSDLDPKAVYLQSYTGQSATDSPLAIHHELRRTRPELTLYWGVADHSVVLPEGAVPVVMRSREWYDVLGSATYLISNIDFDAWFRKRPGQRFLQTFHGYPAKSMGLVQWRAKGFSDRQIAAELRRTAEQWDLILTPVPEMDEHYRREYAYDGPIHHHGLPRDDALSSPAGPAAVAVREQTRRRLGIEPGQTAVLYAPTFRDDLATAPRAAAMADHLDLESASAALGPDYVIMVRGHRFHARGAERMTRSSRLVDVTDYPEINDLILASDAAVLDYSSLRFDVALAGKPMVFLVPDLEVYSGPVRGFLFDYGPTAPGPLLADADEVVAALRDLDGLRASYGERVAELNATYQYRQDGHATERVVEAFFD